MASSSSGVRASWYAWLAAVVVLQLAQPALGRDPDRFKALVEQATRAFGDGDFARAEQLALEAYALKADPQLLYNAARAREANGNLTGAIEAYERYLSEKPEAEDASIVAGRVKALRSQIARAVLVDAEQYASLGRRSEARAGFQKYLELVPDTPERKRIEGRIRELDHAPKPTPAPRPSPVAERRTENRANPWPWVLAASGVLAVGGGGFLALASRQKYDRAREATTGEDAGRYRDEGDQLTDLSNVALVTGGVLMAAGVSWWLVAPTRTVPSASVGVTPGGVAIRGRF